MDIKLIEMDEQNEIRKELYKKYTVATFDFYSDGNLYYTIQMSSDVYRFAVPIDDIGSSARFCKTMKGTLMWRWIRIAIEDNDLIKI